MGVFSFVRSDFALFIELIQLLSAEGWIVHGHDRIAMVVGLRLGLLAGLEPLKICKPFEKGKGKWSRSLDVFRSKRL